MPRPSANPSFGLTSSSTLASGGSGYSQNDVLTVVGGTLNVGGAAASITVTNVIGGVVTTFSITLMGDYFSPPTASPLTVTGGTGTGCTLNAVFSNRNPGFTQITHYGTNTAGVVPVAGSLGNRELFIDTATPTIYTANTLGTPIKVVGSLGAQNLDSVTITGGTINNTSVGVNTPAAGAFNSLRNSSFTTAGAVVNNATGVFSTTTALPETFGGTSFSSPTGYVRFNGASAPTQVSAIPNSDLANSSITLGTTQINLGSAISSISGLSTVSVNQLPTLPSHLTPKSYVDSIAIPGTGTVTSVGVTVPAPFQVSPATITSSGTFAITYGTGQIPVANLGSGTPSATTVLLGNGTWGSFSSTAVQSFSAGTTGFTPSTATQGAITLAGTLVIANGGTGATTIAAAQNNLQVDPAGTALAFAIALG